MAGTKTAEEVGRVRAGLVIFDLDGTLFRVDRVSIPAVQRAMEEAGLVPPTPEEIQQFFGRPDPEFHAWLRARYPGITQQTIAAIPEWELRLIPETGALYPGVLEALTALRGMAEHLAICSNGYREYVESVVRAHGLAPFFDAVRWRQVGDTGKPQMVRELLAEFPVPTGILVGDRGDDIAAAHANGLRAVASCYGFGTREELAGAEAWVESPGELPGVIRGLLERV